MQMSRLGEILVANNLITREHLAKSLEEQKESAGQLKLGSILIKNGFISEQDLTSFLSKQYGVPSINLAELEVDPAVVKIIPPEVAQKYQIVPVNRAGSTLIVAMSDPSNIFAIDDIKFLTGYNVEVVVASEQAIKEAIERYYAEKAPGIDEVMSGFDDSEVQLAEEAEDDKNVVDLER